MDTFKPKITRIEASGSVETRIKSGRALVKEGKFSEALAEFEAAIRLDPHAKAAHLGAGAMKARLKRFDDAIAEFKEVLRLDPMNIQAFLRLARVLMATGDLPKAREYGESALRIDPKSAAGYLLVGQIALEAGEVDAAKEKLARAVALDPRMVRARLEYALAFQRESRLPEALSQLNAAVRIEPDNAHANDALGKLHLQRQDFQAAKLSFEKSLGLRTEHENNRDSSSLFGLAEALIALSDPDGAEAALRKVVSKPEGQPEMHKLWGDIYFSRSMWIEAVEEYRAATMLLEKGSDATPATLEANPDEADLAAWETLAHTLRTSTDAERERARHRQKGAGSEVDD